MRILILGGDGYLGWPTAMHLASRGHKVTVADNFLRRRLARETSSEPLLDPPDLGQRADLFQALTGQHIAVETTDLDSYPAMAALFEKYRPQTCVHYAEQPSAPYSMRGFHEADLTLRNNLAVTFNCIWAVKEHAPDCHIVKLGTMGEYGTPDIDIEEGWLDIEHKGRKDTFLFPRQAGSLYHTTKILDTDLLWFYVRTAGLRVTDLMQGPVYGLDTDETALDPGLGTFFHYDDIFGTVVNRFLAQAMAGVPMTIYGTGGQTRGYLNLRDTLQCVELAALTPPAPGELRILNQMTEEFSVLEIAARVRQASALLGIDATVQHIDNPRIEAEEHYYNPTHSGLMELGLKPHFMTNEVLCTMIQAISPHKDRIDRNKIMPRVRW